MDLDKDELDDEDLTQINSDSTGMVDDTEVKRTLDAEVPKRKLKHNEFASFNASITRKEKLDILKYNKYLLPQIH